MLKCWTTVRFVALSGIALATVGCGSLTGWWSNFWPALATTTAIEFLTDNNAIFDLFTDN